MKRTLFLFSLGLVLGACSNKPAPAPVSAPETPAPAGPEAPIQVKKDSEKPTPQISGFIPLKEDLTQLLASLGVATASQRYEMPEINLTGPSGSVNLKDLKGKVVLFNLWATWCPPCKKEMPTMEALHKRIQGRGIQWVAVSVGEKPQVVTDFLKQNPYSFPIYWDPDNSATADFSSGSIPTTYIIGKDGRMLGRVVGARDWNAPELDKLWDYLLKE